MSILGRVLLEDLVPAILRRKPSRIAKDPRIEPRARPVGTDANFAEHAPREWRAGMKTLILNWSKGENDPFTHVSAVMSKHFSACGKDVEVVDISSDRWPLQVADLGKAGVEFAYTWQGLGSPTKVGSRAEGLWEVLHIPLICVHGDHPSHMPSNHQLDSRYCFHLYANGEHARYANRHFRRSRAASVVDIPRLHDDVPRSSREGDYFILAKNLTHPLDMEGLWRARLDPRSFGLYMMATEALKTRIPCAGYVETHDVLDELIQQGSIEWLDPARNPSAFHQFHSQLDFYARNFRTVRVVASLRDVPLRIYGRGWDRIVPDASPKHSFHPGRDMASSQDLYYSRFGIIDISPSRGLHDRTRRAMANGCGFLSSADLDGSFEGIARFNRLFFDFAPDVLSLRCAEVMQDPEAHATAATEFGEQYHARFSPRAFVRRLEDLALIARNCSVARPNGEHG